MVIMENFLNCFRTFFKELKTDSDLSQERKSEAIKVIREFLNLWRKSMKLFEPRVRRDTEVREFNKDLRELREREERNVREIKRVLCEFMKIKESEAREFKNYFRRFIERSISEITEFNRVFRELLEREESEATEVRSKLREDRESEVKGVGRRLYESDTDCSVCMSERRSVVIFPCRHLCVCDNCVNDLDRCPICRHQILHYNKIYWWTTSGLGFIFTTIN